MKRLDRIVLRVFLYGLPLIIVLAVIASFFNAESILRQPTVLQWAYDFTGLLFGLWILFSLYLCIRLIFSGEFRESALSKLAQLKERDEREVQLSGRATRSSFLSTLAILICLLALSVLQISVYRVPPEKAINGKTGTISLGVSLNLLESQQKQDEQGVPPQPISKNYFTYSGFPVTKAAILLFLIVWQILSYNFAMRRASKN